MSLRSRTILPSLLLGLALAFLLPGLSLLPWESASANVDRLELLRDSDVWSKSLQGADGVSTEHALYDRLIRELEEADGLVAVRWLLLVIGVVSGVVVGIGAQVRALAYHRLEGSHGSGTLAAMAWNFLPWGILGSLFAAAAGLGLAWVTKPELPALHSLWVLNDNGLGSRIVMLPLLVMSLSFVILPFPQILRSVKQKWGEAKFWKKLEAEALRVLSFIFALCLPSLLFTIPSAMAVGTLAFLGIFILLSVSKPTLKSIPLFDEYAFVRECEDGEGAFWLARGVRVMRAFAIGFFVSACVWAGDGELSLRVATIIVIASAVAALFLGYSLSAMGVVWLFFAQNAGYSTVFGPTLAETGALVILAAALADFALARKIALLSEYRAKRKAKIPDESA